MTKNDVLGKMRDGARIVQFIGSPSGKWLDVDWPLGDSSHRNRKDRLSDKVFYGLLHSGFIRVSDEAFFVYTITPLGIAELEKERG